MIPRYISIKNFMSHRETEIDCTLFDSVLIVGQNKNNPLESNGSGKTTIFYAIDYALFGVFPSDTVEEIIRDGCSECIVTFDFSNNLGTFRIVRSRKRKTKKTFLDLYILTNNEWNNISKKTITETAKDIQSIIGITYNAFKNSVLFSQFDLNGIISDNPIERKNTLKEALGLTVYKKFEEISKKDIKDIKTSINACVELSKKLDNPDVDVSILQNKISSLNEKLKANENVRVSKQHDLNKLFDLLVEKKRSLDVNNIHDKIKNIKEDIDSSLVNINNYKQKISDIESLINSNSIKLVNLDRDKTLKENELNTLKESLCNIDSINATIDQLSEDIFRCKEIIISTENDIININIDLSEISECPTCFQSLNDEYKEKYNINKNNQIEKLQLILKDTLDKKILLSNTKDKLVQTLNDEKIKLSKINKLNNDLYLLNENIKNTKCYLDDLSNNHSLFISSLNDSNHKLSSLQEEESKILIYYNTLNIQKIYDEISVIDKNIIALKQEIDILVKNNGDINKDLGSCTERLAIRQKDKQILLDNNIRLKELQDKLKISQIVMRSFSPRGIPTLVIYTILNDLQIEVNRQLAILRPGLEIQILISKETSAGDTEDTLDIKFFINGKNRSYKMLSGGQKFLFAVSMKLGLSIIIQKCLNVDIKFLELDEVDQSLDKAAVNTYADIIKKLQKDFKIFVITHNDSLKYKFDNAILVEGDSYNGASSKLVSSWN